ncbi:hypothetical protein Q3G72_024789 [Acer saccharum]|nr:hypothetical protein Q3G72_024789 [Acer saccharum]
MAGAGNNPQPCAVCRHQRRRCDQNCETAPYLPASTYNDFDNAHKLFGVRNIDFTSSAAQSKTSYCRVHSQGSIMIYKHDFPPVVAEALAVHRGLLFVRDAGLLPCVVETDAQVVVKLIEFSNAPLSDVGIIICDIFDFLD